MQTAPVRQEGAYVLYLQLSKALKLDIGALRASFFPAGYYVYVGSAAAGIEQRIARHRRLAEQKTGKMHWHIDYLLTHPKVRLVGYRAMEAKNECRVSRKIAAQPETTVPVAGFGSTDCKARCQAHLYRVSKNICLP